ncbi:MAG TPA: non-homologous end-joining DNA ligase [Bryobacteraceae bacterium]|nr:non-homologous end-joining DNA ligase [Bryobacteraceae bacterium]
MEVSRSLKFIEPMLLATASTLPEGGNWSYEVKLDGYRAVAFKSNGKAQLRSRNDRDFNARYPAVVKALAGLPHETVIDGEITALDDAGRPSFNLLQNSGPGIANVVYYVFDVMVLDGRDLTSEPLSARRDLLHQSVLPKLLEPVRESPVLEASLGDLVAAVRAQGLEGLVAKRRDSRYEPGERTGAWQKMRLNVGQEFVIGGYTTGTRTFDGLIFGFFDGDNLVYVGRTRSGFTPALREKLIRTMRPLEINECPFVNLPESQAGRWGQGLTAEKMSECRWLRPTLVGQFEFVEWTPDNHLRHVKFVSIRDDRNPRDVRREP